MNKELEALETLKDMLIGNGVNDNINDYVDNLILPIKQYILKAQKEHKTLEIIKEKRVDLQLIKSCSTIQEYYEKANRLYGANYNKELLTEEEFNLLKEVLE